MTSTRLPIHLSPRPLRAMAHQAARWAFPACLVLVVLVTAFSPVGYWDGLDFVRVAP